MDPFFKYIQGPLTQGLCGGGAVTQGGPAACGGALTHCATCGPVTCGGRTHCDCTAPITIAPCTSPVTSVPQVGCGGGGTISAVDCCPSRLCTQAGAPTCTAATCGGPQTCAGLTRCDVQTCRPATCGGPQTCAGLTRCDVHTCTPATCGGQQTCAGQTHCDVHTCAGTCAGPTCAPAFVTSCGIGTCALTCGPVCPVTGPLCRNEAIPGPNTLDGRTQCPVATCVHGATCGGAATCQFRTCGGPTACGGIHTECGEATCAATQCQGVRGRPTCGVTCIDFGPTECCPPPVTQFTQCGFATCIALFGGEGCGPLTGGDPSQCAGFTCGLECQAHGPQRADVVAKTVPAVCGGVTYAVYCRFTFSPQCWISEAYSACCPHTLVGCQTAFINCQTPPQLGLASGQGCGNTFHCAAGAEIAAPTVTFATRCELVTCGGATCGGIHTCGPITCGGATRCGGIFTCGPEGEQAQAGFTHGPLTHCGGVHTCGPPTSCLGVTCGGATACGGVHTCRC